jgi:hypothetical protein
MVGPNKSCGCRRNRGSAHGGQDGVDTDSGLAELHRQRARERCARPSPQSESSTGCCGHRWYVGGGGAGIKSSVGDAAFE